MKRWEFVVAVTSCVITVLVFIYLAVNLLVIKYEEANWKSSKRLEIHLNKEDDLGELIENIKSQGAEKEKILYQKGLTITGIIDNIDFKYLCDYFNSPILDLSDAVFMEEEITCIFGESEPSYSSGKIIEKIILPKAYYEYYDLPMNFFNRMNHLEYVEMKYVKKIGALAFYGSTVKEVAFSDYFVLEAKFNMRASVKILEVSGAYEMQMYSLGGSSLKELIILRREPPKLIGVLREESEEVTITYPNTVEWDNFEQELRDKGFEGKINRIPYKEWERAPLLELTLNEESNLKNIYESNYDKELSGNGLKIIGTIDNDDFEFLCDNFNGEVLDLSKAVFVGDEIDCQLKNRKNIKKIVLPQAQEEYYGLVEGFLSDIKELDSLDMSHVGYIKRGTFSKSSVNKITFSDSFRLGAGAFEGMISPIKIDINGVYEIERTAFKNSNIEMITIMSKEPPVIIVESDTGIELPEYTIFVYPDTVEWDGFEQVLSENGYIGLIRRDPFEE